ncbi:hypothetical protein [Actinoplanes sp. NPDC049118]|uniref:hypothetical protein n=1 Tax=Actinoplanes sp. NPDC049118 TaxID=3155769 RepID=UPI0033FA3B5A
MPSDPLRPYRLRVFDGTYEVLTKRPVVLDLDLDSPATASILDRQLTTLTRAARILENDPMASPRLEVWDVRTGEKVRDVF